MNLGRPVLSRAAWLVLAVSVLAFSAVIAVGVARNHRAVDVTRHAAGTANKTGIELRTVLSLKQTKGGFDVVAKVSILNTTDQVVNYVGIPCYAPAHVRFASNLTPPFGPAYSPAAATLRVRVMDYRRSLDEGLTFTQTAASSEPCDEAEPPVLSPRQSLTYTMSSPLGVTGQPFIDPSTTDVITTLRLGSLPQTEPGRPQEPMRVVDTVEVRNALAGLTDITKSSAANYPQSSRHFDLMMQDTRIAAWVDAQDPALWRGARLMDPYPKPGEWRLTAFHRAWALPLVVIGSERGLTGVKIPHEPLRQSPSAEAAMPPDAISNDKVSILYHDLSVGDLELPSGKVMVGDIVSSQGMLTFDYGLKPGRYPIHIVTTRPRYLGDDNQGVAWEQLVLSKNPVTHWQPAVPVGHTAKELKPGELFSWGTDGAGGGFASPEAMKVMDASLADLDNGPFASLGEREEANDWLWALITVDSTTQANVFATSTGADGGFPVLLGLDSQNRPAVLLSDFNNLQMSYSGIRT